MPRGNGMGPMGMGPMTGRGVGHCAGLSAPCFAGCLGYGRGGRRRFCATGMPGYLRFDSNAGFAGYDSDDHEMAELKRQQKYLEEQLHFVKKRLSYLKEDDE